MFRIEESFDAQLLAQQKDRPAVVITEPLDARVLEAVCFLTRYIKPILLAGEDGVREAAARHLQHLDPSRIDYSLRECAFVDIARHPGLVEEFAAACLAHEACRKEAPNVAAARKAVSDPGLFGIHAVHQGHADMVVGGAVHGPRFFFRPMLGLLANRAVVCEVGIFVLPDDFPEGYYPHNIAVFGDVGVNAVMTPEILAEVAVGTCAVARDLIPEDVLPEIRGAIVSYSHRGSDEGPSPEMVRRALQLIPDLLAARIRSKERYRSIRITGEVKFSAAISRRSAELYGVEDLTGGTNVIISPNLETGNLLYHLYAARFPTAKKFPVIFGTAFRGVDLPMDCTPDDVRLAVKASVLRLQRDGRWTRTPKDTFFRRHRVLVINPGSTSTKIAVYEGEPSCSCSSSSASSTPARAPSSTRCSGAAGARGGRDAHDVRDPPARSTADAVDAPASPDGTCRLLTAPRRAAARHARSWTRPGTNAIDPRARGADRELRAPRRTWCCSSPRPTGRSPRASGSSSRRSATGARRSSCVVNKIDILAQRGRAGAGVGFVADQRSTRSSGSAPGRLPGQRPARRCAPSRASRRCGRPAASSRSNATSPKRSTPPGRLQLKLLNPLGVGLRLAAEHLSRTRASASTCWPATSRMLADVDRELAAVRRRHAARRRAAHGGNRQRAARDGAARARLLRRDDPHRPRGGPAEQARACRNSSRARS